MNRLELVNKLHQECSVSGNAVPSTIDQTGEYARLVAWIDTAYEEIQTEYFDWKFLKVFNSSFTTNTGTNIIPAPSDLGIWDVERMFDDSGNRLDVIEYADLIDKIDNSITGKPSRLIIMDDNTLMTDPYPDDAYTYEFDYFKVPDIMTADGDTPIFPANFHRVIYARAMILYGNYEAAEEVIKQGTELYKLSFKQLMNHQLPRKQDYYGRGAMVHLQVTAQ